MKISQFSYILLGILLFQVCKAEKPDQYQETVTQRSFTLKHGPDTEDNSIVWFEFTHTGNHGWIAIGAGQITAMANMDIWKFIYQGGTIQAIDQFAIGIGYPSYDIVNDLQLDQDSSNFNEQSGTWKVVFSRKIDTGDEQDAVLLCGRNTLALAVGRNHRNSIHSSTPRPVEIFIGEGYGGCGVSSSSADGEIMDGEIMDGEIIDDPDKDGENILDIDI